MLNTQFRTDIATAKATHQTEIQSLKDQVAANKASIEANRKNFQANFSGAKSYLSKPIT
ncbi:MAG: hypothetical protein WCH65_01975 [bacterium]